MSKASLFRNNRNQAVRLPKALAFPNGVTEVEVTAIGRARLIAPAGGGWDAFFDGEVATADFMAERDRPPAQDRKEL